MNLYYRNNNMLLELVARNLIGSVFKYGDMYIYAYRARFDESKQEVEWQCGYYNLTREQALYRLNNR